MRLMFFAFLAGFLRFVLTWHNLLEEGRAFHAMVPLASQGLLLLSQCIYMR